MIMSTTFAVSLGILLWITARIIHLFATRSHLRYPPGPRPKLLIGNALDFPLVNAAMKYMEWGKEYNSSILHIEALGNHIIILNAVEDAIELLERRASNYSDRPVIPIAELMGWNGSVSLLRHDDKWRLHRRICQQNFRKAAASKYHPMQTKKVHAMLQGLLETPENFDDHNKMLSISIPLSSMYGYEAKSLDDPCVIVADKAVLSGGKLLPPGANFIDIIPALGKIPGWFPGAYSVRAAAEVKRSTKEMIRIPMDDTKQKYAEGRAIPSLVTDMLEKKLVNDISTEEEEAVVNIAYTVYGGASDTTISATKSFFYYMATHPSVQQKAHEEIDRVIGTKRLPQFSDRNSGRMPYIEAIYRELLRITQPMPLSIPHSVSQDDHFKGYFIPKGTTVFANVWAMTHDETKYLDPYTFNPERFLSESGKINDDDRILAYGFGRRWQYVASSTMWFIIVSILACFDIAKAKDKNGEYIEIEDEFEEFGIFRHKSKFQCSITARSPDACQLILSANGVE